jgi:hypothetical protein
MRRYIAILLAGLLALAGVLLGLWWAPFATGLALGVLERRARVVVPAGAAIGLVAWAIPLAAIQAQYGVGATAASLAAIMGFSHQGLVPIVLTLLVGGLLGVSGAWLGATARGLVTRNLLSPTPPAGDGFGRASVDAARNG